MKHRLSFSQKEEKLKLSLLDDVRTTDVCSMCAQEDIQSIDERICQLLRIINKSVRPATNMLFFVMYDISSTKVRNLVSKFLIRKGCFRIQRSIFLADLPVETYEQIRTNLAEVQAAYENEDSILIVPISEGYLNAMRVIGQKLDMEVMLHRKNVLFF